MNGATVNVTVPPQLATALGLNLPAWARRCLLLNHRVVAVTLAADESKVGHFCQTCGKDRP